MQIRYNRNKEIRFRMHALGEKPVRMRPQESTVQIIQIAEFKKSIRENKIVLLQLILAILGLGGN